VSEKLASPVWRSTIAQADAAQQAFDQHLRSEATSDIGRLALAALGVGVAGRGLSGLYQNTKRDLSGNEFKTRSGPSVLTLPYPIDPEDDPDNIRLPKKASDAWNVLGAPLTGALTGGGLNGLYNAAKGKRITEGLGRGALIGGGTGAGAMLGSGIGGAAGGLLGFGVGGLAGQGSDDQNISGVLGVIGGSLLGSGLGGYTGYKATKRLVDDDDDDDDRKHHTARKQAEDEADIQEGRIKAALTVTRKTSIPWYRPAMALAGVGGLIGGWKGLDVVLDRRRQAERESELEDARKDFREALLSQYASPSQGKIAAESLTSGLGDLFDTLCKMSEDFEIDRPAGEKVAFSLNDAAGSATGAYGTYALLSGLMTGALVYDKTRKRQRRALIESAMKRRQRKRFNTSPSEIIAVPQSVPVPKVDFRDEMDIVADPLKSF